jgi:phospholipase/carboxylesterase
MTEPASSDFGSRPDRPDQFEMTPWGRRFMNVTEPENQIVEAEFDAESIPTHGEIIELIESLHAGEKSPFEHRPATTRVHSVYVPEHYEHRYAYPLIIWFHSDGASEAEIDTVMPKISNRNYIGLSLRGNVAADNGFRWNVTGSDLPLLIGDIETIVKSVRRTHHIHSERIYLAGFGSGATAAASVLLERPEWFGGAACYCGPFPEVRVRNDNFDEFHNKRVLLATSVKSNSTSLKTLVATGRLLYASGMKTGTRVYQSASNQPTNKMLSDINHWVMDDVCSPVA